MSRILRGLVRVLSLVFGAVQWTPPVWLHALHEKVILRKGVRKATILSILLLIVAAVAFFYPREKEPEPELKELEARIIAPGLKLIGKDHPPKPLIVRFDGSAARIDQVNKEITDGPQLDPEISGTWKWSDDNELSFHPTEDWPIRAEFELTIDESFLAEQVVLDEYEFQFETPAFTARIEKASFLQDEANPDLKSVVATLKFSHPVDKKSLEERIRFALAEPKKKDHLEKYGFEVSYSDDKDEAFVRSHSIPVPMRDALMNIEVTEGVRAVRGGPGTAEALKRSVTVPGMYSYFRVLSAELGFARNEDNEPEQVLVLGTKVQVHEKQMRKNLRAWVLPKDKPALDGFEAKKNYTWHDEHEIGPRILSRSEPLELTQIPSEREHTKTHSFKFKAPVGRQAYVKLKKGTKAWGGYVLADTFDQILSTREYPKELLIMHDGALLATSGEKKLSVLARGMDGVAIELSRVMPDELGHFVSQTGGSFKKPYFKGYYFDEENVSEIFTEKRKLDNSDPSKTQFTAVDFSKYLFSHKTGVSHGLFLLKVQQWEPERDITRGRSDRRLVLVTDLGLLAKEDALGNVHVFVQSIRTGKPRGGVLVEILGKNGLTVLAKRTDMQGQVRFPSLQDFSREKSPVAIIARSGDDFSYLPLGRSERYINFSRFDVDGVHTDGKSDKLDAFLFSDRGIYRPGDTFNVGLIAKAADWTEPTEGIPIQVSVTDPRGVRVFTDRLQLPGSGFVESAYTTEESSPTGTYTVTAHIVRDEKLKDMLGSTTLRVEEFLPDRLRIGAAFLHGGGDGWISPDKVQAKVTLHNLFGTPAANRRISGRVILSARYPAFEGYRDYRFHDPMAAREHYTEALTDLTTDENGEAVFEIDLSKYKAATYSLSFMAEGFEAEGGRSVSARATTTVSPLQHIVGYKTDGGGLRYIDKQSERKLHFIALNNALKKTSVKNLRAILYETRYVSTLVRQNSGLYRYESVKRTTEKSRKRINIPKAGREFVLPTDQPGEFTIVLEDEKERQLTSIPFSVAGEANLTKSLERSAELEVKLDKGDYAPGDEIQVSIKAPYKGAGLITIEQDRVFQYKWFSADTTSSVQTITVPQNLGPNAYVNVAFTRRIDSSEIFMKPLSYAVKPFSLKRTDKIHQIELHVPDLVEPGDELEIGYTTEQPSKIVIFAVDEGILQVAGYRTPDPLDHFLAKRALEVTTSQILDMILPEHRAFRESSKTGGGDEEEALGHNLNPFKRKREKPVAFWSGIVDADADAERRTLTYDVPDYFNGTLRVMAVAVSREKLGATERQITVRGPFVIHPSAPLFAAPGDTFEVSATVANNIEGSGDQAAVAVSLQASENLKLLGAASHDVVIPEGREASLRFRVRAEPQLGGASLVFRAQHKKKRVEYEATLSVRPKTPHVTTLKAGSVKDGKVEIKIDRQLYREHRKLKVSVSPLPLVLADGLVSYLEKFPHGCTEQLVSQTVPSLVLGSHPEFGYDRTIAGEAVARTIRMLRARQNEEGAFGYWAANSHVSDYQVVYATQFLTEARERRYSVPGPMREQALEYLESMVGEDIDSRGRARLHAYAIYILARNGKLAPDALAALREHLAEDKQNAWYKDTTLGYLAATYMLMQDRRGANILINSVDLVADTEENLEEFYDNQSYRGVMLYLLAKHFPDRLEEVPASVIEGIAQAVAKGRYNTISSARLIYGLEAYGAAQTVNIGARGRGEIRVSEIIADDKKSDLKLEGDLIARASFSDEVQRIEVSSASDHPVFYQVTLSGFDRDDQKIQPVKSGVEIFREYRTADNKPLDSVRLGEEIEAVIKIRSLKNYVSNLAIVDLLPAGFEAVLGRGEEGHGNGRIGLPESTWIPEYADVREDRVVVYGRIGGNVREFVYRLKAISRGTFSVPPAYMKSMYDPEIQARTESGSIEVVDPR